MLATILLLAQIVQSWPGLDSPIVQPGPTICMGECAGPVVWGPAERGRLVVACDMRSNTCSDGRKITTTRATPVPCEVAPGQWEIVGPNEGCYSVRGLESWAANTSYLAYGADLDHPAWSRHSGISVAARDGVWEIMRNRVSLGGVYQDLDLAPVEPEAWTASCVMKAGTTSAARLVAQRGAGWARIQLTENWNTYSVTNTVQPGQLPGLVVGPDEDQKSILVAGCWLTRTSTPGRPCWGGEAPVTCDGDRNSISTDGWPTESGEISVTFRAGPPTSGDNAIIESRDAGGTIFFSLRRRASDGRISLITSGPTLDGASVEVGDTAHVRVVRDGSTVSLWVNGTKSAESGGMPAWVWSSTAVLGRNHGGPSLPLNGSISNLRVRSFE